MRGGPSSSTNWCNQKIYCLIFLYAYTIPTTISNFIQLLCTSVHTHYNSAAMVENKCETRGWQVGKSLKETNLYMLENHIGCDVTFQIHSEDGSTTKISAHKYMLVSRSPVFEAMLCGPGDYKETSGHVVITDIESEVFREMIR